MGVDSTYQELFALRLDIMQQSAKSPAFKFFNRSKIKTFFNENAMRLKILDDDLRQMYDAHVQQDDKHQYIKAEDGKDWLYKSVEDKATFHMKFTALMERQIVINL